MSEEVVEALWGGDGGAEPIAKGQYPSGSAVWEFHEMALAWHQVNRIFVGAVSLRGDTLLR